MMGSEHTLDVSEVKESVFLTAIVLAAGRSRRMGTENKLTKLFSTKTILLQVLDQLIAARPDEILLVTGHEQELVMNSCAGYPVKFVHNSDFENGMTSSIQTGIRHAASSCQAYMIIPGDMPFITSEAFESIISEFKNRYQKTDDIILVPTYDDQWGHPKVFAACYKDMLLSHQQPHGFKELIVQNQDHLITVSLDCKGILTDIDTPEDYQRYVPMRPR